MGKTMRPAAIAASGTATSATETAAAAAARRTSGRHPYSDRYGRRPPESILVPQALSAIDGRKQRADGADAAPRNDVDFDARFVKGPQHAGVIRAGGSDPAQKQRGSAFRGVEIIPWLRHES